jgi:hypothetical protein
MQHARAAPGGAGIPLTILEILLQKLLGEKR